MLVSAWKMANGIALHINTQHANLISEHVTQRTNTVKVTPQQMTNQLLSLVLQC